MKKIVYAIFLMIFAVALTTNVLAAPSFTANDLTFGSDNQQPGVDVSQTLTLTNTGDADLTLGLTSGLPSQYNVRFSQSSVSLAQGSTATVTVTVFIPLNQDSGRNEVLSGITVASTTPALSDNVRTFIEIESMLEITKVTLEVDGDENTVDEGETYDDEDVMKPGASGTLTVYVKNNFDINMDLEDIEVDVDSNGDLDLDDSDDLGDLSDGDKDSISFDFDIPSDAEDGDDYDVDVEVTARDEDGNLHRDTYSFTLEIQEETHQISITDIRFSPQTIVCEGSSTMTVEVENTGKNNEDNVQLLIESESLDIEEGFNLGDLDEDDDARKSFTFTVDKTVAAGEYDFIITTYYDVDEDSETEVATLTVASCAGTTNTGTTGTTSGSINTGSLGTGTNTQPTVPIIVTTSNAPTYGSASFTDSPLYMALLVAGVVVLSAVLVILLIKFVF